jgi:hypothetical protein
MDVDLLCVLSGRGLCDELITRPGVLPTVARRCVIKKPRERGGHSPRRAEEPEKIIIIRIINQNARYEHKNKSIQNNNAACCLTRI